MNSSIPRRHASDSEAVNIRILIASAGRRNYLVNWFRDALGNEGLEGRIYAGDVSPDAPARFCADEFIRLPPVASPDYYTELIAICEKLKIDLALSLNDYENSLWSELGLNDYHGKTTFLCADSSVHKDLEDKLACHDALLSMGLNAPVTLTASEVLQSSESVSRLGHRLVIKNRFGSGSYGLCLTTSERLETDLHAALASVRDHRGRDILSLDEAAKYLVIQEHIDGIEYGLDIVNDFDGDFVGCLARQKLAMRGGETSSAITVEAKPFRKLAQTLAGYSKHKGLIDTDVICDDSGDLWVIDINPRFGGGYPFSHYAGANVPGLYVRWLEGGFFEPAKYVEYASGITSHKTISIVGELRNAD